MCVCVCVSVFVYIWTPCMMTMMFHASLCEMPYLPFLSECVCARSYLTHCDPMEYSLPGSSVHRIFQKKILKQLTISYSRRSS